MSNKGYEKTKKKTERKKERKDRKTNLWRPSMYRISPGILSKIMQTVHSEKQNPTEVSSCLSNLF